MQQTSSEQSLQAAGTTGVHAEQRVVARTPTEQLSSAAQAAGAYDAAFAPRMRHSLVRSASMGMTLVRRRGSRSSSRSTTCAPGSSQGTWGALSTPKRSQHCKISTPTPAQVDHHRPSQAAAPALHSTAGTCRSRPQHRPQRHAARRTARPQRHCQSNTLQRSPSGGSGTSSAGPSGRGRAWRCASGGSRCPPRPRLQGSRVAVFSIRGGAPRR